jgi:hypothetical protein
MREGMKESIYPTGEELSRSEIVEAAWRRENFELNGRQVEIFGLAHVMETLDKAEFREELAEAIKKASVVVLEAAPVAERVFSNEMVEALREAAEAAGEKKSREEIVKWLESHEGLVFFREMERLAAQYGKLTATVDPLLQESFTSVKKLNEKELQVFLLKCLVFTGATFGLAGMAVKSSPEREGKVEEIDEEKNKVNEAANRQTMTRRKFLKTLLGGTLGAAAGASGSSMLASLLERSEWGVEMRGRKENPLGPALYDLLDYRDVAAAKGLSLLAQMKLGEGPIVVIYGGLHSSAIKQYALSPKERDIKYAAYAPYRSAAAPALKVFEFKREEGWQKVMEEKI